MRRQTRAWSWRTCCGRSSFEVCNLLVRVSGFPQGGVPGTVVVGVLGQRSRMLKQEKTMRKMLVVVAVALLSCSLANFAVAQEKATSLEVVAKVKEAATALSKTHDLSQFNQKQ